MFKHKIQETMDRTVCDIFNKNTVDEKQFAAYDRRFKLIDVQMGTLKRLNLNMDELMRQMGYGESTTQFLSKSLPLMIHVSVCEAIGKVVGEDYRKPLREFERSKLQEIEKYIEGYADSSCIKNLHYKLMTFMKYFLKNDKGMFGITYGEDVHS